MAWTADLLLRYLKVYPGAGTSSLVSPNLLLFFVSTQCPGLTADTFAWTNTFAFCDDFPSLFPGLNWTVMQPGPWWPLPQSPSVLSSLLFQLEFGCAKHQMSMFELKPIFYNFSAGPRLVQSFEHFRKYFPISYETAGPRLVQSFEHLSENISQSPKRLFGSPNR